MTTGRATEFEHFSNDGTVVVGSVATSDDRMPVPVGKVVVMVSSDPDAFEGHVSLSGDVEDGSFLVRFGKRDFTVMRAEYLPPAGYGACARGWTERR